MALDKDISYAKIGIGVSIFVGGGVALYAALRFSNKNGRQKSTEELAHQVEELRKEIEKLNATFPCQIEELKAEIQKLHIALSERRSKSQSNLSVYSYRTAWSEDEIIDDGGSRGQVPSPIEGGDFAENNNAISVEEKKRALYGRIDSLYSGCDEDKETAMRVLQDNEINYKDDWEFLWRLGRSHISVHEMRFLVEEKKVHALAGLQYTERALDLYEASTDVHKWYAIALGTMTDYVSTKEKILNGFKLKDHIKRALELSPTEPTLHFMMGRWCWGVYMLTWIERKLASTLFATPPTATIEEALDCFLKAEEIHSGFYKANQLYLGKCYYEMRKYDEAKKWLQSAKGLTIVNNEDQTSHDEVIQLLEKL